ncbi:MAG TPA: XRE family transcriptional regulator [Spirochaetes bacterium]|nr:XRE family transcriptional regulator [Spirochaetota bacterium]
MHVSEKVRLLRKEIAISQAELGRRIGGDARQISLYETRKIFPSSEAAIKLARVFDVNIDYLLIEEAERCPLKIKKDEFSEDYRKLKDLGEEDRKSVLTIIDSLYTKAKIAELTA